ncbi:YCII-related domain-containing protein [Sphingomonas antarctica]|uniref:YciI family protein n=1 Tax=Sphingomonas antarctica TaxID=2040274 RepID=UPI0039EA631B
MRVIVFVKATLESESGIFPEPETSKMMAAMDRFNDELRDAGILVMAEGLKSSASGKRVLFDGSDRTVSDGPFANPSELVAGFWLWDVKDMDDAIAWVKRCPNPMQGPSIIEIRAIADSDGNS